VVRASYSYLVAVLPLLESREMGTLYERLRNAWLENGVVIRHGATPLAIERFENQYHVKLPNQFRDYLSTSNGMVNGQTDNNLLSFLSLDAIDHEMASHCRQTQDVVDVIFAEYLIYSHYYTLRVTKDGAQLGVYAANGTNEKRLAASFDEFIDTYMVNPGTIADCW
jgi:hypothetical protein